MACGSSNNNNISRYYNNNAIVLLNTSGSAQQTSGLVRVAVSDVTADDEFALLPVPRAQPIFVAVARDYAVHAGRPFRGDGARERRRDETIVRATTAVFRHGLDQRIHQIIQTVHVLDQSRWSGEDQKQRYGHSHYSG